MAEQKFRRFENTHQRLGPKTGLKTAARGPSAWCSFRNWLDRRKPDWRGGGGGVAFDRLCNRGRALDTALTASEGPGRQGVLCRLFIFHLFFNGCPALRQASILARMRQLQVHLAQYSKGLRGLASQ